MEIVKIKGDETSVLLELKGESFTLASLLEEKLWENKNVLEVASFREHPYLTEVKLWVKVEKGDVKKVLSEVADSLIEDVKELKQEFKKIL